MTRVFVPGDAGALAVGADEVAAGIERLAAQSGKPIDIVRNGSRGLYWLEPMLEVETLARSGRLRPGAVVRCRRAVRRRISRQAARHALSLGPTEEIPFLKRQTRLTFARCGIVDPRSLEDYRAHGGYKGLERALALEPAKIVEAVKVSGPARPRRRGLPDRHQVGDGARHQRRAEIRRLQCRRRRQRHLRRPHDHGGRSLRADRGDDHRRPRRRRDEGLHLPPFRIPAC